MSVVVKLVVAKIIGAKVIVHPLIGGPALVALVLAASDAASGALIAGGFTLLNTLLLVYLTYRNTRLEKSHDRLQQVLSAPRRAVYNSDGGLIGTVIDLRVDPVSDALNAAAVSPVAPPRRRGSDFPAAADGGSS